MTQNGIKITDLRAEVQTLVNSDPTKYDPNKNGKIDGGDELSQLLSEYQCNKKDLTSDKGDKMWTLNEQITANEYAEKRLKTRMAQEYLLFLQVYYPELSQLCGLLLVLQMVMP